MKIAQVRHFCTDNEILRSGTIGNELNNNKFRLGYKDDLSNCICGCGPLTGFKHICDAHVHYQLLFIHLPLQPR